MGSYGAWARLQADKAHEALTQERERVAELEEQLALRRDRINSMHEIPDEELLSAIINYHPEEDPAMLLSRAYNRIEEMHQALEAILELPTFIGGPTKKALVYDAVESLARKALQ